jgi:hypothetical protein
MNVIDLKIWAGGTSRERWLASVHEGDAVEVGLEGRSGAEIVG